MMYNGNPVSAGIATGPAYLYTPFKPVVEKKEIDEAQVPQALAQYEDVKGKARAELDAIRDKLEKDDPEKAKIFIAHQDILEDPAMDEEIREVIEEDQLSPESAIAKVYDKFARLLSKAEDDLIRERVADINDVKNRLLRIWFGVPEKNLSTLERPVVVVAHDLFPSDTATLDRSKVLAIVTEIGGATSHSAIIARSYEIPALLGVPGVMDLLTDGETVVVDAVEGKLFTQADDATLDLYAKKREEYLVKAADLKKYRNVKPVTKDGVHIAVHLNIGSAEDKDLAGQDCADGVGLFRSEFLYMGRPELPSEEEQVAIYTKALDTFGADRPVTLRTLDIGGDKKLDSMELPVEDNPFLGLRALRLCFAHPDVFKTQLRAALRAGTHGALWIMFPMVGSMDDIRRAKGMVNEVKKELDAEGVPYGDHVKIGIMIEIPSIAMISDIAAKEVDFASIGTNDLCQYLTAVDRLNPTVSSYYQTYHPAMFRLIGQVVRDFNEAGKPVSVCGEMGGDPLSAAVLIGLGFRKLSMGVASVPSIKKLITGLTIPRAEALARTVVDMSSAEEVEKYLRQELADLL